MVVVCGEALVDFTPTEVGGLPAYVAHPGGGPANIAVGLARLGVPAAFLGRLSTDSLGQLLRRHLAANGVDLSLVVEGPESTPLAFAHLDQRGEAEYRFYVEGTAEGALVTAELPAALAPDVAAVHFGSLSLVLEPAASTLEGLMAREHGRRVVSLDPNVRPALIADRPAYLRRLEGWLGLADVVKLSRADAHWLEPGDPAEAVAERWLAAGPALVVVTLGGDGAVAVHRNGSVRVPVVPVDVVDTIGAGDAFSGGALAWLHAHRRLSRPALDALGPEELGALLAFAARVSALTCARAGADPPRLAEVGAPG